MNRNQRNNLRCGDILKYYYDGQPVYYMFLNQDLEKDAVWVLFLEGNVIRTWSYNVINDDFLISI